VSRTVIRGASLIDHPGTVDVAIAGETVTEVGRVQRQRGDEVIDAGGRTLLPGLHDHHIHVLALAAARTSVSCGPPSVHDAAGFGAAVRAAEPRSDGWIRGVGYHESIAGPLDKQRLDEIRDDVAVRIQDASGAAWYVNSRGLQRLGLESDGLLLRMDSAVREGSEPPELGEVGRLLTSWGVTGVTDATPEMDEIQTRALADAVAAGALPQRVTVLSGAGPGLATGPHKILLSDHQLPGFDELAALIATAHDLGQAVAVHSVTRESLALLIAVLDEIGSLAGDRVEHASVSPPDLVERIASLGVTVVTQPNFVAERGDRYRAEVAADDQPWLYRCRGFVAAGFPLAAGTDAPFGDPNPWRAINAAIHRRTPSGVVLGSAERLSADEALRLFLGPALDPGGAPRGVGRGAPADLCLLGGPWRDLVGETDPVVATIQGGQMLHCDRSLR
jgi:predicted amidohydrolase YtcJ